MIFFKEKIQRKIFGLKIFPDQKKNYRDENHKFANLQGPKDYLSLTKIIKFVHQVQQNSKDNINFSRTITIRGYIWVAYET